jgi:hypothetical protein
MYSYIQYNFIIERIIDINSWRRNPSLQISIDCESQCWHKRPSSEPRGATRQQTIAETPAKRSAYQILSGIVFSVVFKV